MQTVKSFKEWPNWSGWPDWPDKLGKLHNTFPLDRIREGWCENRHTCEIANLQFWSVSESVTIITARDESWGFFNQANLVEGVNFVMEQLMMALHGTCLKISEVIFLTFLGDCIWIRLATFLVHFLKKIPGQTICLEDIEGWRYP